MIELVCEYKPCGKKFQRIPSQVKKVPHHFCCHEHSLLQRSEQRSILIESPEFLQRLKTLYISGQSILTLTKRFRMGTKTVRQLLEKTGVRIRNLSNSHRLRKGVRFADLTGKTFGRLTAQWPVGNSGRKSPQIYWLCYCTCGTLKVVCGHKLLSGHSRSCGCLKIAELIVRSTTHGLTPRNAHHHMYVMFHGAKSRAKKNGLAFDIELSDITIPDKCPLLGTPIFSGHRTHRNSPTLDRIIPSLGYVKGNVWVISHRANTIKSDASIEELELIAANLRKHATLSKAVA